VLSFDKRGTQNLIQQYNARPRAFNENQIKIIKQHAQAYNIPFAENEQDWADYAGGLVKQAVSGYISGLTTLQVGGAPQTGYEGVARAIGSIAGFTAFVPSAPFRMLGLPKLAKAAAAISGKFSVPLVLSDKILKAGAGAAKVALSQSGVATNQALQSALTLLKSPASRHFLQRGLRLGTASAISSWQGGINEMVKSFGWGMYGGMADAATGQFFRIQDNPVAERMLRGVAGALVDGLPSTIRKDTTPEQVYYYLRGAYFGSGEKSWQEHYAAKSANDFISKKATDPDAFIKETNMPSSVAPIFKNFVEEHSVNSQMHLALKHEFINKSLPDIEQQLLEYINTLTGGNPNETTVRLRRPKIAKRDGFLLNTKRETPLPSIKPAEQSIKVIKRAEEANTPTIHRPNNVKIDYFNDPDTYYRIIVGDEAFNHIVSTNAVSTQGRRFNAETLSERLKERQTAFPSFSKGRAQEIYAKENENHYIVVTQSKLMQPSKSGRHGKGTTMFPTDADGRHMQSLPGSEVDVYKHMGGGKYELVYSRGIAIDQTAVKPINQGQTKPQGNIRAFINAADTTEAKDIGDDPSYPDTYTLVPIKDGNYALRINPKQLLIRYLPDWMNQLEKVYDFDVYGKERDLNAPLIIKKDAVYKKTGDKSYILVEKGKIGYEEDPPAPVKPINQGQNTATMDFDTDPYKKHISLEEYHDAEGNQIPEFSGETSLYHGTRASRIDIDKSGALTLLPSTNFDGMQTGVSFTHSRDVAKFYGEHIGGRTRGVSVGSAIIEINRKHIPSIVRESDEEFMSQTGSPIIVPPGGYRIYYTGSGKEFAELVAWETAQLNNIRNMSVKELVKFLADGHEANEMAERDGTSEPDWGHVAPGVSQLIAEKYGRAPELFFGMEYVPKELRNRIRKDPDKFIEEAASIEIYNMYGRYSGKEYVDHALNERWEEGGIDRYKNTDMEEMYLPSERLKSISATTDTVFDITTDTVFDITTNTDITTPIKRVYTLSKDNATVRHIMSMSPEEIHLRSLAIFRGTEIDDAQLRQSLSDDSPGQGDLDTPENIKQAVVSFTDNYLRGVFKVEGAAISREGRERTLMAMQAIYDETVRESAGNKVAFVDIMKQRVKDAFFRDSAWKDGDPPVALPDNVERAIYKMSHKHEASFYAPAGYLKYNLNAQERNRVKYGFTEENNTRMPDGTRFNNRISGNHHSKAGIELRTFDRLIVKSGKKYFSLDIADIINDNLWSVEQRGAKSNAIKSALETTLADLYREQKLYYYGATNAKTALNLVPLHKEASTLSDSNVSAYVKRIAYLIAKQNLKGSPESVSKMSEGEIKKYAEEYVFSIHSQDSLKNTMFRGMSEADVRRIYLSNFYYFMAEHGFSDPNAFFKYIEDKPVIVSNAADWTKRQQVYEASGATIDGFQLQTPTLSNNVFKIVLAEDGKVGVSERPIGESTKDIENAEDGTTYVPYDSLSEAGKVLGFEESNQGQLKAFISTITNNGVLTGKTAWHAPIDKRVNDVLSRNGVAVKMVTAAKQYGTNKVMSRDLYNRWISGEDIDISEYVINVPLSDVYFNTSKEMSVKKVSKGKLVFKQLFTSVQPTLLSEADVPVIRETLKNEYNEILKRNIHSNPELTKRINQYISVSGGDTVLENEILHKVSDVNPQDVIRLLESSKNVDFKNKLIAALFDPDRGRVFEKILADEEEAIRKQFADGEISADRYEEEIKKVESEASNLQSFISKLDESSNIVWFNHTRDMVLSRLRSYVLNKFTSPKVDNAGEYIVSPYNVEHTRGTPAEALDTDTSIFMLGNGGRRHRIKLSNGEYTTLGEMWDKYQASVKSITDYNARITEENEKNLKLYGIPGVKQAKEMPSFPEMFNFVVVRAPMDGSFGALTLKFNGFTDAPGYGIFMNPNSFVRLGGADTDIDSVAIYTGDRVGDTGYGISKEFKEVFRKFGAIYGNEIDGKKYNIDTTDAIDPTTGKPYKEWLEPSDAAAKALKTNPIALFSPIARLNTQKSNTSGRDTLGRVANAISFINEAERIVHANERVVYDAGRGIEIEYTVNKDGLKQALQLGSVALNMSADITKFNGIRPAQEIISEMYDRAFTIKAYKRGAAGMPASNVQSVKFDWSRYSDNGYEVSTHGDKEYSALNAKLKDGRTIEEAYQQAKGSKKGEKATDPNFDYWGTYLGLWRQWAKENPAKIEALRVKAAGKTLTDKFAKTDNSQARALATILNEATDAGLRQPVAVDLSKLPLEDQTNMFGEKKYKGYVGGFKNIGKGTPEGDGKDKAMRETADGFIGEIKSSAYWDEEIDGWSNNIPKSSSETSMRQILEKIPSKDSYFETSGSTAETVTSGKIDAQTIMLARNSSYKGMPLMEATKIQILDAHKNGARFVVGDMPGVDDEFVYYLNEIGAKFEVYHTGDSPRINRWLSLPSQVADTGTKRGFETLTVEEVSKKAGIPEKLISKKGLLSAETDKERVSRSIDVMNSPDGILSNDEITYLRKALGVKSKNFMPKVATASERSDPAFFSQEVIKLASSGEYDALYIITKHDGIPILDILKTPIPKVIHFSITTLGGTKWEPGVMKYNDLLDRIDSFIKQGLDPETITIRIDPLVPGVTKMSDVEEVMKRASGMGVSKFKISVMDSYNESNPLFKNMKDLGYDFRYYKDPNGKFMMHAKQEIIDEFGDGVVRIAKKYGITKLFSCADFFSNKEIGKLGCVDVKDVNALLGTNITQEEAAADLYGKKRRKDCTCYNGKSDILQYTDKCRSSCAYCYARHGGNTYAKYYDESGALISNALTKTTRDLSKTSDSSALQETATNTQRVEIVPPVVKDFSRLSDVRVTDSTKQINTLRSYYKDEIAINSFGNPFAVDKGRGTIKLDSIKESVKAFTGWLSNPKFSVVDVNGKLHENINQSQRRWILKQIDEGMLDGKELLYYKSGDYYSHADALAEFVANRRMGKRHRYDLEKDIQQVNSAFYHNTSETGNRMTEGEFRATLDAHGRYFEGRNDSPLSIIYNQAKDSHWEIRLITNDTAEALKSIYSKFNAWANTPRGSMSMGKNTAPQLYTNESMLSSIQRRASLTVTETELVKKYFDLKLYDENQKRTMLFNTDAWLLPEVFEDMKYLLKDYDYELDYSDEPKWKSNKKFLWSLMEETDRRAQKYFVDSLNTISSAVAMSKHYYTKIGKTNTYKDFDGKIIPTEEFANGSPLSMAEISRLALYLEDVYSGERATRRADEDAGREKKAVESSNMEINALYETIRGNLKSEREKRLFDTILLSNTKYGFRDSKEVVIKGDLIGTPGIDASIERSHIEANERYNIKIDRESKDPKEDFRKRFESRTDTSRLALELKTMPKESVAEYYNILSIIAETQDIQTALDFHRDPTFLKDVAEMSSAIAIEQKVVRKRLKPARAAIDWIYSPVTTKENADVILKIVAQDTQSEYPIKRAYDDIESVKTDKEYQEPTQEKTSRISQVFKKTSDKLEAVNPKKREALKKMVAYQQLVRDKKMAEASLLLNEINDLKASGRFMRMFDSQHKDEILEMVDKTIPFKLPAVSEQNLSPAQREKYVKEYLPEVRKLKENFVKLEQTDITTINKIIRGMTGKERDSVGKDINMLTLADVKMLNNYFDVMSTPQSLIKMLGGKNLDDPEIRKIYTYLFPEDVGRDLARFNLLFTPTSGWWKNHYGKVIEGEVMVPTNAMDILAETLHKAETQTRQLQESRERIILEELYPYKQLKEYADIVKAAFTLREANMNIERVLNESPLPKELREVVAKEYREEKIEALQVLETMTAKNKTLSVKTKGEDGNDVILQLSPYEIAGKINEVVTRFNKEMVDFTKANEDAIAEVMETEVLFVGGKKEERPLYHSFKMGTDDEGLPKVVKIPIIDRNKLLKVVNDSLMKTNEWPTKFGIDGLKKISMSILYSMRTGNDPNSKLALAIAKSFNEFTTTGEFPVEQYFPHRWSDTSVLNKSIKKIYAAIDNDETMDEKVKADFKKYLVDNGLKSKTPIDQMMTIHQFMDDYEMINGMLDKKLAEKARQDNDLKFVEGLSTAGNQKSRVTFGVGYDKTIESYIDYMADMHKTYFKNMSQILARIHIARTRGALAEAYGDEVAYNWSSFLHLYTQAAAGYHTVIPEALYENKKLNIKGTLYATYADNHVANVVNNMLERLGISSSATAPKDWESFEEMLDANKLKLLTGKTEIDPDTLHKLSALEGKWSMATLLARVKTPLANLLGGTMNTMIETGPRYLLQAQKIEPFRQIHREWDSHDKVNADLIKWGVIEDFMLGELGLSSHMKNKQKADFFKEMFEIIKKDPNVGDATLKDLAKKHKIFDAAFLKLSWPMRVSERKLRLDSFKAKYLKVIDDMYPLASFSEGTSSIPYDSPVLIELAKRSVKATQFLYSAPFRPMFSTSALGKIMTRFQLYAYNSIKFRRDTIREAALYGYTQGTESFKKFERMAIADAMSIGLASAFMYSLFDSNLPQPYDWAQNLANWIFGNEEDRDRAFYGTYPAALAPLQIISPPSMRLVGPTITSLINNDWARLAQTQIWTLAPLGPLITDINRALRTPDMAIEKITGIPYKSMSNKLKYRRHPITGRMIVEPEEKK